MKLTKSISPNPVREAVTEIQFEASIPVDDDVRLTEIEQAEALKRFAENLLAGTEDNPQEVVDVLNQHFWDLV